MYAIIFDRNKQYFVKKGLLFKVDFLNKSVGDVVKFDNVLFFSGDNINLIGDPFIEHKVVISKVISEVKDDKKIALKFKRRKHHMKKKGHRQKYILLEVLSIEDK
jgi:large subunit ribosomal protein L21